MTHQTKVQSITSHQFNRKQISISSYWMYLFLGLLAIGYVLYTLNGYGNHDDIYRMLSTWRILLSEHRYEPSRFQGYLVPEMIIGFTSQLGGFYLSNLVSASLAIVSLGFFYQLLRSFVPPLPAALAALAVGTNPYWVIAATTSTDYIYPAFFGLLGAWLLVHQHFRVAGLVFALAVSSRITYAPMITIAYGFYFFYLQHERKLNYRFFQGIGLLIVGTIALYLPVFFASGMTLSFLSYADDASGGVVGNVARFFYKNVYFWGLPTFIGLIVLLTQNRQFYWSQICKFPLRYPTNYNFTFHAVLWLLIYNELMFAKLPHQYQYLLPILFCVTFFIVRLPNTRKQVICLSLIALLHLVHGVINFDVLETYQTDNVNSTIHSDGAVIKPGIREGILLRDYQWRSIYQRRMTTEFNQRWQHFGQPLKNPR